MVICDDGAVFELNEDPDGGGQHWEQYPSVPGTRAREGDSNQVRDEFLQMAIQFFREHLHFPDSAPEGGEGKDEPWIRPWAPPADADEPITGPTLEGEAARHREPEAGAPRPLDEQRAKLDRAREEKRLEGEPPRHKFREPEGGAPAGPPAPTFFCAFHGCPGYHFKASDRSHPEDVCGRPERHLDRPEPAKGDDSVARSAAEAAAENEPYRGADL